jgi:LPXTG-motif cell wall-anchored protein
MRRPAQITTVALTAALWLPAVADARQPPTLLAANVLADAAPVTSAPVPRHALSLEHMPLAARDRTLLADAGNPRELLAQAPTATATPPTTSLPRTGSETYLTLLAGAGLLLAGAGLRLRTRASAVGRVAGAPGVVSSWHRRGERNADGGSAALPVRLAAVPRGAVRFATGDGAA